MRIGFVDHHLNNFHANKFLALLRGPLADRQATVAAAWESDPVGDDWCAVNGVPRAASAAEVARQCDAVMLLAPDNTEAHLALAREVSPFVARVFVDKFLAPTVGEAVKLIDLAERNDVALFSSSSLRFAVELEASRPELHPEPSDGFARGMGEWSGYGVHTVALVHGGMGAGVKRVIDTGNRESAVVALEYGDGRRAWLEVRSAGNQWEALPWSFGFRVADRYVTRQIADFDGFYANLMRRVVHFFDSGESPFPIEESLEVVSILAGARESREAGGIWVNL